MTIPAWPAGIPYASTVDGQAIPQLAAPPLGTDMNAGTTRYRRKYTLRMSEARVAIVMSDDQWQSFRTFHASLGDGAARFTMPVWNGSAYVTRTVQIKEGPDMSPRAFRTRTVGMTLRIENL